MNRSTLIASVMTLVTVAVLFFLLRPKPPTNQHWYPSYAIGEGQMPYDLDVFVKLLEHNVGPANFTLLKEPFTSFVPAQSKGLYVCAKYDFNPNREMSVAIIKYAEQGNNVFIAAENYGNNFVRTLNAHIEANCHMSFPISKAYNLDKKSLKIGLWQQAFLLSTPNSTGGWFPYRYFDIKDVQCDRLDTLGIDENDHPNCLVIRVGEGKVILHAMPVIFTNYQLKSEPVFQYLNALIEKLNFDVVYVDEQRFINALDQGTNAEDAPLKESAFKHIFANKALKTAFFLLFFGIVFFVFMAMRRKQPVIPVLTPLKNTSIDFSKSIARLYQLRPNHKKIAEKKMKYFLYEVRQRYGIETEILDNRFTDLLSQKTGLKIESINKLIEAHAVVIKSVKIHPDLLLQISESVTYIRKHWK